MGPQPRIACLPIVPVMFYRRWVTVFKQHANNSLSMMIFTMKWPLKATLDRSG